MNWVDWFKKFMKVEMCIICLEDYACMMKVDVNLNRDGNIPQDSKTVVGAGNFTFKVFFESI